MKGISSLRYFIIDLKDPCLGTYQIGKEVRGSNLALTINEIVARFDKEEAPHSGEVYIVKSTADQNSIRINKELFQSTPSNIAGISSLASALNAIVSQNCYAIMPSVIHFHLHANNVNVIDKLNLVLDVKQMGDNYGQIDSSEHGDTVCYGKLHYGRKQFNF